jgi:hypothetical protein
MSPLAQQLIFSSDQKRALQNWQTLSIAPHEWGTSGQVYEMLPSEAGRINPAYL